ncbi:hypothetical protein PR202_gb20288 [Eleusine coracana subsp. coracana]|uniref:Uncharacterized protein n=1 Tax=Eleusine coracana subsp. coracana TaxID=191504 RepID=A0AAV5F861_ELECO|nr:hypothetical protein PR202_gb20288 [Eleusine coracana subsp. coracana]
MASPDDAPPATVVQMPPQQLNGTTPKQVTNDESTSMPTAASPNTMTDKLYYDVATPQGFKVFNFSGEEADRDWTLGELHKLRLRPMDYVHAFFTVVVFLTVAFSDVGFQKCFFPHVGNNASELLTNLPLGMAFLSSFVFTMFLTTRKGIRFNDISPHKKAS